MQASDLQHKAAEIRLATFKAIASAGGGHFGGCMSEIEILTTLYFAIMKVDPNQPAWDDRDRFVLAKGHGGPALYVILSDLGFFPKEWLAELDRSGSRLPKHIDRLKLRGIDYSSGPLGQGLSVGVGMALGARLDQKTYKTYVVMGDGECNSGQVWEAAMTASKYGLDNLIAFVDRNGCQIDGKSDDVMPMEPLDDKWRSFGWNVLSIDGHNVAQILEALEQAANASNKPTMIIARTLKGKGVSFMEDRYEWHSGKLSPQQRETAIAELERRIDGNGWHR